MFSNSEELLKFIKDEGVEMVDVRFCDLPGVMQHFTVPVSSFSMLIRVSVTPPSREVPLERSTVTPVDAAA